MVAADDEVVKHVVPEVGAGLLRCCKFVLLLLWLFVVLLRLIFELNTVVPIPLESVLECNCDEVVGLGLAEGFGLAIG